MTEPENLYSQSVDVRFPAAQKRCQELMSEQEWKDFVRDAPSGGLLEAMENWLKTEAKKNEWICGNCGCTNSDTSATCWNCGG